MSSKVIVSGRIVLPWLIYEAVCPIRPPRVEGLGKSKRKSHRYWAVGCGYGRYAIRHEAKREWH